MSSKTKRWMLPVILLLSVIWACQNVQQEQGINSESQDFSLSEVESRGDTDSTEEEGNGNQ